MFAGNVSSCPNVPAAINPTIRYGDFVYVTIQGTTGQHGKPTDTSVPYCVSKAFSGAQGNWFATIDSASKSVEHQICPPAAVGSPEYNSLLGQVLPVNADFLLKTTQAVPYGTENDRVYLGGWAFATYYYRAEQDGVNNEFWRLTEPQYVTNTNPTQAYYGIGYHLYNTKYQQYAWIQWTSPAQLNSSASISEADTFSIQPSRWNVYICNPNSQSCSVICGQTMAGSSLKCTNAGCFFDAGTGYDLLVHPTLDECQAACRKIPTTYTWDCVNGKCQTVATGGSFQTEEQCKTATNNCQGTTFSCNPTSKKCEPDSKSSQSLADCQKSCKMRYSCDSNSCQCYEDLMNGKYDDQASCKTACSTTCKGKTNSLTPLQIALLSTIIILLASGLLVILFRKR